VLLFAIVLGAVSLPSTMPIRVEYDAPPECPQIESFVRAIHARTGAVRLATEGEQALRVRVRLTRAGARFEGELRVVDEQGETVRSVEGSPCDQVVDALSLTAALAFDRTAQSVASPAPKPSPIAQRAPAAPFPLALALGARAVTSEVVSPFLSVGGELFVRLTTNTEDVGKPTLDVGVLHARNDLVSPADGVWVRLTAITLSACPVGWAIAGAWRVQPCAVGLGGWLAVTDRAVDHPSSALRSWWSVGARARAAAALGAHYALELEAGVSVPLIRRRFFANTEDQLVGETPVVSALGAIGFVYSF
jgi:hypothetical protein